MNTIKTDTLILNEEEFDIINRFVEIVTRFEKDETTMQILSDILCSNYYHDCEKNEWIIFMREE
jgi:hypothetical protein